MPSDSSKTIKISTGTLLKIVLVGLLVYLLYIVRETIGVLLLSIVIASGVEPAAKWLQAKKIPRVLAVLIIYIVAVSVVGLMFYLIIPPVFNELSDLVSNIPNYLNQHTEEQIISAIFPKLPESISEFLLGLAEDAKGFVEKAGSGLYKITSSALGGALSFVMVFVLSFYFSVQERGIENFLRTVLPLNKEEYFLSLWERSRDKIGAWLKGQLLLGLLVGVLVFLSLTILRVKYALIFALFSAVFEIIPIFGPILASVPAIGIAFLQSPLLALIVAAVYFVIQQFENHLIYPLVVRKVTGISPVLVILALIVGGKIGGLYGLILSVPITTVLVEALSDYEKEKRLAKPS